MRLRKTRSSHVAARVSKQRRSADTHAEDKRKGILLLDRERCTALFCVLCAYVSCEVTVIVEQEICLTVQLESLAFEEKANRRYKNATPTKLYSTAEVSKLKRFSLH